LANGVRESFSEYDDVRHRRSRDRVARHSSAKQLARICAAAMRSRRLAGSGSRGGPELAVRRDERRVEVNQLLGALRLRQRRNVESLESALVQESNGFRETRFARKPAHHRDLEQQELGLAQRFARAFERRELAALDVELQHVGW